MRLEFQQRDDSHWRSGVTVCLPNVLGRHHRCEAVVDSGASVSLISPDVFGRRAPPYDPSGAFVVLSRVATTEIRAVLLRPMDVVLNSPHGEALRLRRCRLHVAETPLPVALLLGLAGLFEHANVAFRFDPSVPEASFFTVGLRP